MRNFLRRIEKLEQLVPNPIVLTLYDGTVVYHPGPPLELYMQGMEQIRNGEGKLLDAIRNCAKSEGCARLVELLQAVDWRAPS